jgi:outer membrane protein assembly factor BamB
MRLRVLLSVALVFVASGTPAVATRLDPGRVPPLGTPAASNTPRLQLAWTANTGSYTSPPAVVEGVVYVGTKDGPLYAFSATCRTGGAMCHPLWTGHSGGETIDLAGDEVFWSPVVVDGAVLVLGDHPKQVKAFSTSCASRCQPLWVGDIGAPTGPCASCPTDAGNAYVTASDGVAYVDAFYGRLYAFPGDCRTDGMPCQPLWVAPAGDPAGVAVPVVSDGVLYNMSGTEDRLSAYDAKTGKALFRSPSLPGCYLCYSAPVLTDGNVYVNLTAGGFSKPELPSTLYAFPASCGTSGGICEPLWSASVPDDFMSDGGPTVENGVLFVGTERKPASGDGRIYAFPATCTASPCRPLWRSERTLGEMGRAPVAADGIVYAASLEQGVIEAFPTECSTPCRPLWHATVGDPLYRPVVQNGVVYLSTASGRLEAFAADCSTSGGTCEPLWRWDAPHGERLTPLTIANGMLYVSSDAGTLYAFVLP